MPRFEVVESKRWEGPNGRTASIYGACPWASESERAHWVIVVKGYTVRDNVNGTVGMGKPPTTRELAEANAEKLNALHARR